MTLGEATSIYRKARMMIDPQSRHTRVKQGEFTETIEEFHNRAMKELKKIMWEVRRMPDRDGRGPRKRSPYPSKKKGGQKKGKC